MERWNDFKLEVHSVERIYLRQWCFDASKPCVAASTGAQYGFSRCNKIPRCRGIRYGRKQSGSGIRTMIRIGLKN